MYVDAIFDKDNDLVKIVERRNGKRIYHDYKPNYTFYYTDPRGKYTSIFDDKLIKVSSNSTKEFRKELSLLSNKKLFESDTDVIFRTLEDNYKNSESPDLNIIFFDIEVASNKERGFAPPEDPFNEITAISCYLSWIKQNITLALIPETLTMDQALKEIEGLENTYLFDSEKEMLEMFLELIEDGDVLSGWNSTKFDIPYIVRRIELIINKEATRKLCLWNMLPKKKIFYSFKKEYITYILSGRLHLDYFDLYQKHSQQQTHSYKLDYIGELEVGEKKIPYTGSLDDLYKKDFRKFIEYNKQDVMLLVKIDARRKYIALANNIAHTNCFLLPTTMGSVALIEAAIALEAHNSNLIVPNRKKDIDEDELDLSEEDEDDLEESDAVAGAYVVDPKVGLHDWIGSVDINSLYPSVIRTFNMSPETLVGQLRPTMTDKYILDLRKSGMSSTAAWGTLFTVLEYDEVIKKTDNKVWLDLENGSSLELTGAELYDLIFNMNNWCITANGTIFTLEKEGIIPQLLTRWYSERKEMQRTEQYFKELAELRDFTPENRKIYKEIADESITDISEEDRKKYRDIAFYWETRSYIRKISLNSLYGALLNEYCKYYDQRLGQSVTLTGRNITKHMSSTINEIITGEYNHIGDAVKYGDSVHKDSILNTSVGNITIEELYELCPKKSKVDDKEYAIGNIKVLTFDTNINSQILNDIEYVYRHKVSKERYRIYDEYDNYVEVTGDHSIMVERDGILIDIKPSDILENDKLITIIHN